MLPRHYIAFSAAIATLQNKLNDCGYPLPRFGADNVVIVVAICLCVGYIIKHFVGAVNNKFIPLILSVLGVVLNMWVNAWAISPEILLGGLASGLASSGAFEFVKGLKCKDN